MEHKKYHVKKRLMSIDEDQIQKGINNRKYSPKKPVNIDLEIYQKDPENRAVPKKIVVTIEHKSPQIETIYQSKRKSLSSVSSISSFSSLSYYAKGDYSSKKEVKDKKYSDSIITILPEINFFRKSSYTCLTSITNSSISPYSGYSSSNFNLTSEEPNISNNTKKWKSDCYGRTHINMNVPLIVTNKAVPQPKTNISASTTAKSEAEGLSSTNSDTYTLSILEERLKKLERKVQNQEMVIRSLNNNLSISSSDSDGEANNNRLHNSKDNGRPCCSYIEYSHVPETSAFHRYAQLSHGSPMSTCKATINKDHNSEQYGRDFTTYDGITARGRRQTVSMPVRRDDTHRQAAERVHKIRHKLNPIRDYRLMDTVHYLAQGEFAPRDDGIKLTPSREQVLSDIIMEDVCRTHWPTVRLNRRIAHTERSQTRSELQRLIDSLLRERVAHVERRRRRHYRIVKLNHRHESCRPLGKTGDIIVASHKDKPETSSDHNTVETMLDSKGWDTKKCKRVHKSDQLIYTDGRSRRHFIDDDCDAGPSNDTRCNGEATCCFHTSDKKHSKKVDYGTSRNKEHNSQNMPSNCTVMTCRRLKQPRLLIKKDSSRKKLNSKEDLNLEHYVLLPTLVIRTPSNMKRQKKFNALYHRVLNNHLNGDVGTSTDNEDGSFSTSKNVNKKDVGLNVNLKN